MSSIKVPSMYRSVCVLVCACAVARTQVIPGKSRANDGDYNTVNTDGSFDFGYANKDRGSGYHLARGNANRVVGGRFGSTDPATGTIKETVYTAGPRGFRAKGPNVHRKMDLDQRPRGPIGNKDDPYFDPSEDPSYSFKINTRTYSKNENADSRGDVKGHYSYVDDIGERHDVSYIAGRDTGFHVSSAHPDSPSVIGSPFHRAPLVRGEARPRGRTAIQRGLDGSYRFISAGPDQRRTESSDSQGNVRGSYSFLDDKGVQRTVHYIAGPGIGYRIVKNSKDPFIPAYFPTIPSAYDPDFVSVGSTGFAPDDNGVDDVFKGPEGTAASGHVKPSPFPSNDNDAPNKKPGAKPTDTTSTTSGEGYYSSESGPSPGPTFGSSGPSAGDGFVDEDVFGKPTKGPGEAARPTNKPYRPTNRPYRPTRPNPQKKPYVPIIPSKPNTHKDSVEDTYDADKSDENIPQYGIGFNIQHVRPDNSIAKPGSTIIEPGSTIIKPASSGFKPGSVTKPITFLKPGTTIIRNIGQDYFGVPPGVSVRAHVQSIDLYPYDSKPLSPSEAIENDKT